MHGIHAFLVVSFSLGSLGQSDPCDEKGHLIIPNIGLRYINYRIDNTNTAFHDALLTEAWYDVGDAKMPEKPPDDIFTCGTKFPIWLNGTHPTDNTVVNRTACQLSLTKTCEQTYSIKIKKCDTKFLYYIGRTGISVGYCFGIGQPGSATKYVVPKPKLVPELQTFIGSVVHRKFSRVRFICHFTPSSETLYYMVSWFSETTALYSTPLAKTWNDEGLYLTEETFISKGFRLGTNIACSVTAFKVEKGPPSKRSQLSDKLFAGIKVLTPSLTFVVGDDSPKRTIRLQLTIPIGCSIGLNCTLSLVAYSPKLDDQTCVGAAFETSSCGVNILSKSYTDVVEIPIKTVEDGKYAKDSTYEIFLKTNRENGIWKNYALPSIKANIKTKIVRVFEGKRCQSDNDPHMTTFDRRRYDNHQEGTFIMYKNTKFNTEVQVQYKTCGNRHGNLPIKCNCGVAVRAGKDLYRISVCDGKAEMRYKFCDDDILQVESYSEFRYKIYFPYGTYVDVTVHKPLLTTHIYPSVMDEGGVTRGLCGIMDNDIGNDYHYRDGTHDAILHKLPVKTTFTDALWAFDNQPKPFIEEWRVKSTSDNLFDKNYNKNNFQLWTTKLCVCENATIDRFKALDYVQKGIPCNPQGVASCSDGKKVGTSSCTSPNRHRRSVQREVSLPVVNVDHSHFEFKETRMKRDNTQKNWTQSEATDYCNKYMGGSPVFHLCGQVPNVDPQFSVENCVMDIMLTGETTFSSITMDAMQNTCLTELKRNTTLREKTENKTSIAEQIEEKACPNMCSSNGICNKGTCNCNTGYGGSDCSIDLTRGPTIAGLLDDGFCDEQQLTCDHAYVFGQTFTDSTSLTCRLEEFMLFEDGSRNSSGTHQIQAEFETFIEVVCPIRNTRRKRSLPTNGDQPFVLGYTISVSNDGNIYEAGKDLFIYNSECQLVQNISGQIHFTLKDGYCYINNKCVPDRTLDIKDKCSICDSARSKKDWSFKLLDIDCILTTPMAVVHNGPSISNINPGSSGDEGEQTSYLWIIGVVAGVLVGVIVGVVVVIKLTKKRGIPSSPAGKTNH